MKEKYEVYYRYIVYIVELRLEFEKNRRHRYFYANILVVARVRVSGAFVHPIEDRTNNLATSI